MPWPEPSIYDHGAPWNEEDELDEDGEVVGTRCGCLNCHKARLAEDCDADALSWYEQ